MAPADSFALKGTSIRIPARGLGTFQADPKIYPEGSVKKSVIHAIQAGYRHLDVALGYEWGAVEREVGQAIKECGIPREELFVVSKLHNVHHNLKDVPVGMAMSLENLGLDYLDLYLMHFPYAYAADENYKTIRKEDGRPVMDIPLSKAYVETWKAMEAFVHEGKTKLLGVSNFSSPKLKKLLESATIFPVVNQVELHPYLPQKGLVNFCREHEIHITAHCPLGGNLIPAVRGKLGPSPLEDPLIKELADKYQKSPAQVILNFLITRGVSVIPKSNNLKRLEENYDVLFDLDPADFEKLDNLKGKDGEHGVRSLDLVEYLGFDNFNEEFEEP